MKKWLMGVVAVIVAAAALAAGTTATVTITPPATYTDGSPLIPADIAFYTLSWSGNGPSGSKQVTSTVTTVPVACGTVTFTATVTTGANAKYPNETSSATSSVPYATGVSCVPNPPSLSVQ